MSTTTPPNTVLDNPQLGESTRHLSAGWVCIACGRPIEARATYEVVFSGQPGAPSVFAVAHHDPPAGVTWERDADDWPINPCARTLERVHHQLLDAAGILRYIAGPDRPELWQRGRPAELGRPPALRDLTTATYPGFILLASGHWARAAYDPMGHDDLTVEYEARSDRPRAETETRYAVVHPPALFRPGGPWQLAGDRGVRDDGGPASSALVLGVDRGGPRWYLGDQPMHAGEALEVFLPGAGWTPARVETAAAGRHANVHVRLAGSSEAVIPAVDALVRPPARSGRAATG